MTIESALRRHGLNVRREVLPNGRLRFVKTTGVAQSAGLPLRPHRFHGGDAVPERPGDPWWKMPDALASDRSAMAAHFPTWSQLSDGQQPPAWQGSIDTGNGVFQILVSHRYDRGLPNVLVTSSNVVKTHPRSRCTTPHRYTNGQLCVASASDWFADCTIADVVGWTAHWLACYVAWVASARWPTEGYVPASQAA